MTGTPRFQHGSLALVKNKTAPATWYFRYYEERDGRRSYRRQRIGSVKELPHRRDAEKAVMLLRTRVNSESRIPETVSELISHYKKHELTEDGDKRASTRSAYVLLLNSQIEPRWGNMRLDKIRAVDVEQWLRTLDYAPAQNRKSETSCPPSLRMEGVTA